MKCRRMDPWMDQRMERVIDGWMDRRVDGWIQIEKRKNEAKGQKRTE